MVSDRAAPAPARRATAVLLVITLMVGGLNLLFTAHYVRSQQAAQQRQGQMVERKICTTMRKLAALRPPAGDPAANPSRAFEQQLHATLDELGPDLGCR